MGDWIDDPETTQRILWLHGPAGVGKSAIAQSVAHSYRREKVAATFFFFRSDSGRNDGNRLFPTLAWQLAKVIPGTRDFIAHILKDDYDIPRKAIEVQFEELIVKPLQAMIKLMPQGQVPTGVVIVDGLDECSEDKLQRRFLNIIGNAVEDRRFPLRFLISSRPEALIQDAFRPFLSTTLRIDLADLDGWYQDVKQYLEEEFARIASEQHLDPSAWPGDLIIGDLVSKSSSQFVYASTIIKFVGDEYNSATSQLDIIMGLKASDGESPFADLDMLYMEILIRQHHQTFLKDFLTLLVARSSISTNEDDTLARDDALLLDISEHELHRKMRGMHSVLKVKPHIDIHHQSFLDFLQEPSRSHQYYISNQAGMKRYLELITSALVRYASKLMKDPDYHETEHFSPAFGPALKYYPCKIELPLQDWDETLRPL
jgi:hypothetical protein